MRPANAAPRPAPGGLRPAAAQEEAKPGADTLTFPTRERLGPLGVSPGPAGKEDEAAFFPKVELPDPGELFRRDSEGQLYERIRLDARRRPGTGRVVFPEQQPVSAEPFKGRAFPKMVELVEPSFVCHGRLLFEQPNFERYGYDFGIFQPGISVGVFWYDTLLLPYHRFSRPCQNYDCSAGKCLPGDPVPLTVVRQPFSLTGLVAQTGTVLGGIFAFR